MTSLSLKFTLQLYTQEIILQIVQRLDSCDILILDNLLKSHTKTTNDIIEFLLAKLLHIDRTFCTQGFFNWNIFVVSDRRY